MLQGNQLTFAPVDLVSTVQSCYGGKATEEIEGLLCSRCSARASQRRCLQEGLGGSLSAQEAYRRLAACGPAILDVEHIGLICPAGSPEPVMCRTTHVRSFRIQTAPAILTLHMRRLIHGPWGLMRLTNPVRSPAVFNLDKILPAYALASVISHLGTATQGHFIAHRAWHPSFLKTHEDYIPLATSGRVELWSSAQPAKCENHQAATACLSQVLRASVP